MKALILIGSLCAELLLVDALSKKKKATVVSLITLIVLFLGGLVCLRSRR